MNTDTKEKSFHESSIYTGGIHEGLFNSLYQTAKFKRQDASIFFHLEIYKLLLKIIITTILMYSASF